MGRLCFRGNDTRNRDRMNTCVQCCVTNRLFGTGCGERFRVLAGKIAGVGKNWAGVIGNVIRKERAAVKPTPSLILGSDSRASASVLHTAKDWGAWSLSLGAHFVVLLAMSLITFPELLKLDAQITSSLEDIDPTEFKFDSTLTDQVGTGSDMNLLSASVEAAAIVAPTPQKEIEQQVEEKFDPAVAHADDIPEPSAAELNASVTTSGATEHAGGVEGAVDRLAFEIASSLRERKTLVIWLFDVSPSLSVRRAAIAERVENVYRQLNAMNVDADKALLTAVATFGEKSTILTDKPVADAAQVKDIVNKIKSESSGKENTFKAVHDVAQKFQEYRTKQKRDVLLIVVTDEAGSDPDQLESALQVTKKFGIRCYCVGDMAPFGRREMEIPFTLESGEEVIGLMERGPESIYQEVLKLGFWGTNAYDLMEMSSGFGPYGLTRLASETNGVFFVAGTVPRGPKFDPVVMRNYRPDYRPLNTIRNEISKNRAKLSLVETTEANKSIDIPTPQLFFRAESDTILRQEVDGAQRPAADFDYKVSGLLTTLEAGEKDRAKLTEPRWRASYDLAMGRLLAMKVRSFGYNALLAEMKVSPKKFEKTGNNAWRLEPAKDITSGAAVKKLAARAADYLRRVVDEHPGTPWFALAERELSQPLGWTWKEAHYNPAPAMGMETKEKAKPRFVEETDPKTGKKTKRELPPTPQRREI